MIQKYVYLVFCLICLFDNVSAQSEYSDARKAYCEILSLYPKELTTHLPKLNEDELAHEEFEFPRGNYLSFIHMVYYYKDNKIMSIEKKMQSKAKRIYHFTDSCLMVINDQWNPIDSSLFPNDTCTKFPPNALPIPNFNLLKKLGAVPEVYKSAVIYVLDAKQGAFLDESCLSVNGVGLPKEWEHGYTKGVLISGNLVFYWLEVW